MYGILQYSDELKLIESLNSDVINQLVGQNIPFRADGIALILIRKGVFDIDLDYNHYRFEANDLFVKLPEHIIQKIEASEEFEAAAFVFKKQFLEDSATLINRLLYNYNYMHVRMNPRYGLSNKEIEVILNALFLIKDKMCLKGNNFQSDIIKCAILMMLLEIENIVAKKERSTSTKSSRHEQIMNHFLELLKNNCRVEHKVEFYADKLFITPQYLSLVLKDLSGKTAYQWIVEGITTEAKILLKNATLNVQQISNILNFPDPSSFGKFFKKQTGDSPLRYRNFNRGIQNLF